MLDLIISGGVAVMPSATTAADIGVAGQKIGKFARGRKCRLLALKR